MGDPESTGTPRPDRAAAAPSRVLSTLLPTLCLWLVGPAFAAAGADSPTVQKVSEGVVDWGAGVIRVQGTGRPRELSPSAYLIEGDLVRKAEESAAAKLLLVARALPHNGNTLVGETVDANPAAAKRLAEACLGFKSARRVTVTDGTIILDAELPLVAVIAALTGTRAKPGPAPVLVLDARGLKLAGALMPVIHGLAGGPWEPQLIEPPRHITGAAPEGSVVLRVSAARGKLRADAEVPAGPDVLPREAMVRLVILTDPGGRK